MSGAWFILRDGCRAEWIINDPPFVRVTMPDGREREYALPQAMVQDGCDFMHRCITNALAEFPPPPGSLTINAPGGAAQGN